MYFVNILDQIDEILDKVASPIYYWFIGILYLAYIATFMGVFYIGKTYLHTLSTIIQVFISLVLMVRFNPLRKHAVSQNTNVLVFACAFFLLLNVALSEGLRKYTQPILGDVAQFDHVLRQS